MRLIVISLSLIFIFSACKLDDNTVAIVGDLKISKDEYLAELRIKLGKKESYKDIDIKNKENILDVLILEKLKIIDAYEKNLDKDKKIHEEYKKKVRQLLTNKYFEKMIVDKLISDSVLKSEFEKTKEEVNVSHVLLSFKDSPRSLSNRSKEKAFNLANEIVKKVKNGEDINKLAVEYSDDKTKDKDKGNLGFFTWGKMTGAFQEKAFSMKENEVSEPVLTDYGYHVIYLHKKRLNPNFDESVFETEKFRLKQKLYTKIAPVATKNWDEHLKNIKDEYEFKFEKENMEDFLKNNIEMKNNKSFSKENFNKEQLTMALASWKDGKFSVADLLDGYGDNVARYKMVLTDSAKIQDDVNKLASHFFVADISESIDLLEDEQSQTLLKDIFERSLLNKVEETVKSRIEVDEKELKKFYNKNLHDYSTPEKMEIWQIFVKTKDKANQVYNLAKNGNNFEQLAKSYSEDKRIAQRGGKLGILSKNRNDIVTQNAFKAGENNILEPFKYKNGWVVLKTGRKEDKKDQTFEEAKAKIESKLLFRKRNDALERWEINLKNTYNVDINEELLAEI